MVIILYIIKIFLPLNNLSRSKSLIYIIIYAISGGFVYILLSFKMNLFEQVLGKKFLNKIRKKLIRR